jgi:hypothetical protein
MRSGRSARLYFITVPARLPFFAANAGYIFSPSKIAAGSAASGASAAEASETSSATAIVAITASASVSSSASAHDVCKEEEDQADVAGLDEEEEYKEDSRAAEHELGEADVDRLLLDLTMVLMGGQSEGNAGVSGDDLSDLADAQRNGCVIVTLGGRRHHGAADVAYLGVVQDALEAVAYLDAASAGLHDEDHQDAAIGSLGAYLPFVLKGRGELFDGNVVVDGFDGDDGDLGVCLAIDLTAEVFDALLDRGRKDACKVIDEAGGSRKRADLFGRQKADRPEQQNNDGKPT